MILSKFVGYILLSHIIKFTNLLEGEIIMRQDEREIQKLLRQLGANGSYTGFYYTVYGVVRTIQEPTLIVYICKGLYIEIAQHFNVNVSSVERNIRTIIDIIWNKGDRDLLNHIFGRELIKKPKNTMFIDALSQYIIDYCEQPDQN